jgi:hypothetical protein
MGRDILNEEYITYGNHFLITSESNIDAVITKIQGAIDLNLISPNSGEIDVATTSEEVESGLRLIIFAVRSVSFDNDVRKAANNLLLEKIKNKENINSNKKEINKLHNSKIQSLLNSLPNSSKMSDYGTLIDNNYTDKSGITGSLYSYKNNISILIHNTNIQKMFGYEGIVYKNDSLYCRFIDKIISEEIFIRTISDTIIKYVNKKIVYIDNKIKSKKIEPLKMDIARNIKYGAFDIETALDDNLKHHPVSCG